MSKPCIFTFYSGHICFTDEKGKCPECELFFSKEDLTEIHHIDGNHRNNLHKNLLLIHRHYHDQVHRVNSGMNDNHQIVEEPDELKGSRPVLKPSRKGDLTA